ncbi:hypothetical protein I6U33_26815 [Pseudomonas carnis]|uniref:hypothetical protein n=1 Tax=Pseudomonas carnis TaxID=2487355 RepID=UPI001C6FBD3F|nr:hypothetical protein [Pseudomonas carnis]MBW9240945.1 hypothetical protein [Pseudomonas carnis]
MSATVQSSTNETSKTPKAESKVAMAVAGLLMLVLLYLIICVISAISLAVQVPISDAEMLDVSYLSPRLGFQYHGFLFVGLFLAFALLQLVNQNIVLGGLCAFIACCAVFATSEVAAFRQGLLTGDARLGCYVYQSLECRKMLDVPVGSAKSIYSETAKDWDKGDIYASWYAPERARFKAEVASPIPSTLPGVALLMSPVTLFQIDEVKARLGAQRKELSNFRASVQLNGPAHFK